MQRPWWATCRISETQAAAVGADMKKTSFFPSAWLRVLTGAASVLLGRVPSIRLTGTRARLDLESKKAQKHLLHPPGSSIQPATCGHSEGASSGQSHNSLWPSRRRTLSWNEGRKRGAVFLLGLLRSRMWSPEGGRGGGGMALPDSPVEGASHCPLATGMGVQCGFHDGAGWELA